MVAVRLVASNGLLAAALEVAERSDRTVQDALYVALAAAHATHLVTADGHWREPSAAALLSRTYVRPARSESGF